MLSFVCGLVEPYRRFDEPLPVTQFTLVSFSFSPPHMPLALSLVISHLLRDPFLHRQMNPSYRLDQRTCLFQQSRSLKSIEQYSICVSAIATIDTVVPTQPSSQRSTKNHLHHNYVGFLTNAALPCYGLF